MLKKFIRSSFGRLIFSWIISLIIYFLSNSIKWRELTPENKENAIKLMEFLSSPDAQKIYALANFEYPIAPNTEPAELVKNWGSFIPDDVNLMDLAKLRSTALKLTEIVDFDG